MNAPRLWELPPSPNSIKVRMALAFKGIEFEVIPFSPTDRSGVIAASGQEGTPVIEDRGIVLNDSEAILQYLDANYPQTPRLYPSDKANRRICDRWKVTLDERVSRHFAPVFLHALGLREELDQQARTDYASGLSWLDELLGDRTHFEGADKPICDLRVATWACYAFPSPGLIDRVPFFSRARQSLGLERGSLPNLERFIESWNSRVE